MTPWERQRLFEWVYQADPIVCAEVGCGLGGGSTWAIWNALQRLGDSRLLMSNDVHCDHAKTFYHGRGGIAFYEMSSCQFVDSLLDTVVRSVDFVWFDGPEDHSTAVADFISLDTQLREGTYFAMHDWSSGIKAKVIRPYLYRLEHWDILEECLPSKQDTVGMVLARRTS